VLFPWLEKSVEGSFNISVYSMENEGQFFIFV